jgi:hypothetical protein
MLAPVERSIKVRIAAERSSKSLVFDGRRARIVL